MRLCDALPAWLVALEPALGSMLPQGVWRMGAMRIIWAEEMHVQCRNQGMSWEGE